MVSGYCRLLDARVLHRAKVEPKLSSFRSLLVKTKLYHMGSALLLLLVRFWRLRLSGTTMLVCRHQVQDFPCILFDTLLILLQRLLESFKL